MFKKFMVVFVMLVVLTVILIISTWDVTRESSEDSLKIVTSFYPMYIAALNVVHDVEGVTLINLTEPKTGCLHDYQITTKDMITLETADIFIINGSGAEEFLEDVITRYPNLYIIDASEGITVLEDQSDHEDNHDEVNPHIWMNISNYMEQVQNIEKALSKVDINHKESYNKNANEYLVDLENLKDYIHQEMNMLEEEKVIIFHNAFDYLAQELKLEVKHIVNIDSDTSISTSEIKEVIDLVKEYNIKVLLTEKQYGDKVAQTIANETDTSIYMLDSLVTGDISRDAYIESMKENIQILKGILN